jgi:hypothetical protein
MRRPPSPPAARHACPARRALVLVAALLVALCAGGEGVRAGEEPPPPLAVDASLAPLRPWLSHADWTLRSLAGFELRRRAERGVILLATELLAKEEHPYAAAAALGALRGRPRRELVLEGGPVLAAALLRFSTHAHPTVAAYAREVLFRLPPVKLGTELSRYEGWWARGEDALAREQNALLREAARGTAGTGAPGPGSSSSEAPPDKSKDFYERLELMRAHGLELCIVMDDTGSMRPAIHAARVGATRMILRLSAFVPRFRAALVSYKDTPYFRIGLTQNADKLQHAFDKMAASGGGDLEEGVYPGIRMALEKTEIAWSRDAYRVVVVIGDAPPHERHLLPLLRLLEKQKNDLLHEHPVVVHMVSTSALPVLHFPQIARAGGGQHLTLADTGALVNALVLLTFGGAERERVELWMAEIDALRAVDPAKK